MYDCHRPTCSDCFAYCVGYVGALLVECHVDYLMLVLVLVWTLRCPMLQVQFTTARNHCQPQSYVIVVLVTLPSSCVRVRVLLVPVVPPPVPCTWRAPRPQRCCCYSCQCYYSPPRSTLPPACPYPSFQFARTRRHPSASCTRARAPSQGGGGG